MIAYTDGATFGKTTGRGDNPIGAGVVIMSDNGNVVDTLCIPCGQGTNNEAEYIGVIEALEWLLENWLDGDNPKRFQVRSDSQLVVRQIMGVYGVHDEKLKLLHKRAVNLKKLIKRKAKVRLTFKWIPREDNTFADKLSKEAAWLASQVVQVDGTKEVDWTSRPSKPDTPSS